MKVEITETTVRELMRAVDTGIKLRRETIRVKSGYSDYEFHINLELHPNTQESLGFRLMAEDGDSQKGEEQCP